MMTWRIVMRRRMIGGRGETAGRLNIAIEGGVRPMRLVIQRLGVGMSLSLLMLILHSCCQESRLKFRILHRVWMTNVAWWMLRLLWGIFPIIDRMLPRSGPGLTLRLCWRRFIFIRGIDRSGGESRRLVWRLARQPEQRIEGIPPSHV